MLPPLLSSQPLEENKRMATQRIQRYERTTFYDLPIYCPYCGQQVLDFQSETPSTKPCSHTLFIAHDEGYDFIADRVAAQLTGHGYQVTKHDDAFEVERAGADTLSPDKLTDGLRFDDGLKIASYVGPPSGFGSYVGFAPLES
jgi:hypothetical protein